MISRLKFEIDELVNEMLDKLPPEIWKSSTTTFFDPSIGGGQFVKEIERRLRENGHSESNINKRVYGFAENELALNYAISKHKLIGNYSIGTYNTEINMKFDIIVGNPPYQESNKNNRAVSVQIWPKFIDMCLNLLKTNGMLALITPSLWLKNPNKYFKNNSLKFANLNCRNQFTQVATTITWFILEKNNNFNGCNIIDVEGNVLQIASLEELKYMRSDVSITPDDIIILNKIKSKSISFNIPSPDSINNPNIYSKKQSSKFKYPVIYSSEKNRRNLWASKPMKGQGINKLCMARISDLNSKNPDWFLPITTQGCGWQMFYIEGSKTFTENLRTTLLKSKLMKFVELKTRYGRYTKVYTYIPNLDFSKSWTDEELYKYFNLTQEEIDLIESTVI